MTDRSTLPDFDTSGRFGRSIRALAFVPLLVTGSSAPAIKEVTVVATDYAFQAPDQLSAGPTAFKVL
ncbi:MAG: hypothetical protein ABJC63_15860, partial [Gemmatimonadales bacterium]